MCIFSKVPHSYVGAERMLVRYTIGGAYGTVYVYFLSGDWWISANLSVRGGFARNSHGSAQPSDVLLCIAFSIPRHMLGWNDFRAGCIAKREGRRIVKKIVNECVMECRGKGCPATPLCSLPRQ